MDVFDGVFDLLYFRVNTPISPYYACIFHLSMAIHHCIPNHFVLCSHIQVINMYHHIKVLRVGSYECTPTDIAAFGVVYYAIWCPWLPAVSI
ncbi:hypothetical protein CLU79DRAFT_889782 [Phycomyces nitens]|nr:hypothetical protein CLU79DRAFT_889782 [Phycomyces nitens]